ncbi:hypothetical protein BvRS1_23090 [Burkholderia vietnamiensis]|nr:hypothetical protein BvRS1_23090 [Burkholderia vietnamiensis]
MPPNTSITSPVSSTARLQTQNFAAGVTIRFHARSRGESSSSNASAMRIASTSAASLSSARSASTVRISGCSASARPNAWRWRVYAIACTTPWRSIAALPSTQFSRV